MGPIITTRRLAPVAALLPACAVQKAAPADPSRGGLEMHASLYWTYTVSASLAQRPSWWNMQTPGPPLSAHWASVVQGTQTRRPVSQMGRAVAKLQSALLRHSTQLPSEAQTAGA